MATVRYTVVNGEVLAEKRGGVRKFYVPDPLGSTVALLDSSQTKTDTYSYWPFGEERSSTGSTPTPFRFGGTLGYFRDSSSRNYLRARSYVMPLGRFLTEDPFWVALTHTLSLNRYAYCENNPINTVDPTGLWGDEFMGWVRACRPATQMGCRGVGGMAGAGAIGCVYYVTHPDPNPWGNIIGGIGAGVVGVISGSGTLWGGISFAFAPGATTAGIISGSIAMVGGGAFIVAGGAAAIVGGYRLEVGPKSGFRPPASP